MHKTDLHEELNLFLFFIVFAFLKNVSFKNVFM